jgi:hypothetical protein
VSIIGNDCPRADMFFGDNMLLGRGAEVKDWPKTGFRSNRMPARRRKKVTSRRAMRDADMAGLLGTISV